MDRYLVQVAAVEPKVEDGGVTAVAFDVDGGTKQNCCGGLQTNPAYPDCAMESYPDAYPGNLCMYA
jgi:hypothetical protein